MLDLFNRPVDNTLDGPICLLSESHQPGDELLAVTSTGSVWLLCGEDNLTVKVLGFGVGRFTAAVGYWEGARVLAVGQENIVRMYDWEALEVLGEMYCPKSRVLAMAHLPSIAVLCSGHEDGLLRAFQDYTMRGSVCFPLPVTHLQALPDTQNLLIGTSSFLKSAVWMAFVDKECQIELVQLIETGCAMDGMCIDAGAPLSRLAVWGTGWAQVWERKDLLKRDPKVSLRKVQQLEYYLIDSHKAQSLTCCLFVPSSTILLADKGTLFFRNFVEHSVTRKLELFSSVSSMALLGKKLILEDEGGQTRVLQLDSGLEQTGWPESGRLLLQEGCLLRLGEFLRVYEFK